MHAPLAPLSLALSAFLAAGCVHGSSTYDGPPVYGEHESNDSANTANYMGLLRPGDFFVIRGDISDAYCDPFDPYAYCDPFDGFAFTAAEPIHVEFRLYEDRLSHDFDVCLYDPQLDLTLDCWQSPASPEVGAVDVFFGGLDFHLVVESFFGEGGYEMEIEVFGLYGNAPEAPGAPAAMLAASAEARAEPRPDAEHSDFDAYGRGARQDAAEELAAEPAPVRITSFTLDPETEELVRESVLLLPDGMLVPLIEE